MDKEIIILADGDFPSHEIPLSLLNSGRRIICCDGAANGLIEKGIIPAAIAGDMDSISENIQSKYASIIFKSEDQETNDLTKAFQLSLGYYPEKIIILGATGKREDHTLGNISLISQYKKLTSASIEMYTDHGIFIAANKSSFFNFKRGTQISLFSLTPDVKVISKGLKYPTNNVIFDSWWKATLNEVSESPFYLEFSSAQIILFAAY